MIHTTTKRAQPDWDTITKKTEDIYNTIAAPLTQEIKELYETDIAVSADIKTFPPRIELSCVCTNHIQLEEFKQHTLELTNIVKDYATKNDLQLKYALYNDIVPKEKKSRPEDWWIPIKNYSFMTLHLKL
ncbi:MAG: hypothetical protein WC916_04115 [Candidatus Woesearchaeota archaeon]